MLIKGMIGLAALFAGGFVTVDHVVVERVKSASERISVVPQADVGNVENYQALRAQANAALTVLLDRERMLQQREREKTAQKAKAADARPDCREQTWPYYTATCIASADGVTVRDNVRVVGLQTNQPILQRVSF